MKKTNNGQHRRVYKKLLGTIPKDEKGRPYQIHHIDGNHSNNDPKNLVALSIVDHFWEHWINGDYGACRLIAGKMNVSTETISELARIASKRQVSDGSLHLLKKNGGSDLARKRALKRVKEGTHPFLGGEIQRRMTKERLLQGTHNFLGQNSPAHKERVCPHCGKIGKGPAMYKWHFNNCSQKI